MSLACLAISLCLSPASRLLSTSRCCISVMTTICSCLSTFRASRMRFASANRAGTEYRDLSRSLSSASSSRMTVSRSESRQIQQK
ncbi:hypothetical protein BJ166DRAFT_151438 [Pestalotiopsis sp. NC0098]|nr:hypothetical protein BJ166DRAFT_151438 [Pestalotiopsis sp. NC0098]